MNDQLTQRQHQAVHMLFDGQPYDAIAQELGVSPRTLRHWRGLPEFRAHLNRLREQAQEAVQDRYRHLAERATNTLETLLDDEDSAIRFKAVSMVLEHCKPFPDPHGASVLSTNHEDFKKTYMGVTVGDRHAEQCQSVLGMLEDFVAGELNGDDLAALLGIELAIEEVQDLVADHERLSRFVVEYLDDRE